MPSGPGVSVDVRDTHVDGDMTPKAHAIDGDATEGIADQATSHTSHVDGYALKPTISRREEKMENDPEGWKKEAWGRELMLVEKMLEADSRNCKCNVLHVNRMQG